MLLALSTVKLVAFVEPKTTADASVKFVPEITTAVPPKVDPVDGLIPIIETELVYVNRSAETIAEVPPGVVTLMSTTPDTPGGETAVICVALFTLKYEAFVEPKVTADALVKFVPVITTALPPKVDPVVRSSPLIVGAGRYV